MKKMLFACACMLLIFTGVMAQNRQGGRRQGGPRFQPAAVIDTAVINHIGLTDEVLAQVLVLQEKQAELAKTEMGQNMQRGQRMSAENREKMMENLKLMKQKFRLQLRELIGDEKYIQYLEASVDQRQTFPGGMQMRQGQMPQGGFGGGRGGFEGGQGGFGGGFGGGQDF